MPRPRLLLIAGAAALLLGLLANLPARVAYHWFAPETLRLSGLSGTLWNGAALEGRAADLYLANLTWRFQPASLLTGTAAFLVEARPPGGRLRTRAAARPGGAVALRDLDAELPLGLLAGSLPLAGVDGRLSLAFERLDVDDGTPTAAEGVARLSGLVIRPLARRPLGDYRLLVETTGDGIRGHVEDAGGMLDVEGLAELAPDGSYRLTGTVAATPQAAAEVAAQLRLLGAADASGRHGFRFEGSL